MEHNVPFKSGCYFRLQKKWLNRHLLPASRYSYVTPFLDIHILHCFSTWITHSNKVEHQTKTEHLCGNRFWCLLQRTDYKKSGWKANSNTKHKSFWEHKEMPRCCWNYRFGLDHPMSNIENRATLCDKYKGKPSEMKSMSEGYDPRMLHVMQICWKSWEAVTSQNIARWCRLSSILSASDGSNPTQIYGKNICNRAQDKEYADMLFLITQLSLDEQVEFFAESDITSVTITNLCEWVTI